MSRFTTTGRRRRGVLLGLGASLALGLLSTATPALAVNDAEESIGTDYSAEPLPTSPSVNGCRVTQQVRRTNSLTLELRACEPGYLLDTAQPRQTSVPESRTGTLSRVPLSYQLPAGVYNFPSTYRCEGTNTSPACGYSAQAFVMWTWVPTGKSCPKALPTGRSYRNASLSGINWSVTSPPRIQEFTGADGSKWSLMVERGKTEIGLSSQRGDSNPTTAWQRYDSTLAFDTAGRGEQTLCAKTGMRFVDNINTPWILFSKDRRIDVLGGINLAGPDYRPRVPSLTAVGGTTLGQDGSWSANTTIYTLNNISDANAIQARELRFRYVKADPPTTADGKLNGGGCRPGDASGSDLYTIDLKQRALSRGVSAANSITIVEKRSDRAVPADATYLCAYQYLRTSGAQEFTSLSTWLQLTPKSAVETLVSSLPKLTVAQATAKLESLSSSLTTALARPVLDQAEIDRLRREAAEAAEQARQAAQQALQQQEEQQNATPPGQGAPTATPETGIDMLLDKLSTFEDEERKLLETRTPLELATGLDPAATPVYPLGKASPAGLKLTITAPKAIKAGGKARVTVKVAPAKWAGTATVYLIRKVDGAPTLVSKGSRSLGAKGGVVTVKVPRSSGAGKYQLLTAFDPKTDAMTGIASFKPLTVRR